MVKLLCDRCGRLARLTPLKYLDPGIIVHECSRCENGPMLHEAQGWYMDPSIKEYNEVVSRKAMLLEDRMKFYKPYKEWYPLRNEDLAERYRREAKRREAMMGRMV